MFFFLENPLLVRKDNETVCIEQLLTPLLEIRGVYDPFAAKKTAMRPPAGGGGAVDGNETTRPDKRLLCSNGIPVGDCRPRSQDAELTVLIRRRYDLVVAGLLRVSRLAHWPERPGNARCDDMLLLLLLFVLLVTGRRHMHVLRP